MTLIRLALGLAALLPISQADAQVRARALGVAPGIFVPGAQNAITDVAGVRVGQVTLIEGDSVRTGITAILPHGGNLYFERVPAAIHVGNGFGKLLGSTQVDELGELESPILLTCTLCVWRAADAPIGDRNLGRVASRAMLGLGRTGSSASNGSGDYVIAFSTSQEMRRAPGRPSPVPELGNDAMSAVFQAVVEATEEAIYNSLFMATTVTSRFGTGEAIPLERVREVLRKYGVEGQ